MKDKSEQQPLPGRHRKMPSYCLHKASGRAIATFSGRTYYLGRYGTAESRQAYQRLLGEWLAGNGHLAERSPDATVAEVITAYWSYAEGYYVKDGGPSSHLDRVRRSLRAVLELYGSTAAREFGPLALNTVRDGMIREGMCRKTINQRIDIVRRAFRWALSRELIPASIVEGLNSVGGLRRGRSPAPDLPPVGPADEAAIAGALTALSAVLADAARLQLLTASRPGETLAIRACDLDRRGPVWVYRPASHKGTHLGKSKAVLVGPKAQEVLYRWMRVRCPLCEVEGLRAELGWRNMLCGPCADRADEEGLAGPWPACWPADEAYYLFSPRESMRRYRAAQRAAARTPRSPKQMRKKVKRPEREPGERYGVEAYARAIARACEKAGVAHWHPHQLRHNAATRIRAEFGIDVARIILGHTSSAVTEIYAEPNFPAAVEAVRKLG